MDPRSTLLSLFDAAIAAADPLAPTRDHLRERLAQRRGDGRGWIIAIGKAAGRMARGARLAAADTDLELAGGLIVSHEPFTIDAPFEAVLGDHPIPGVRSRHAARRLEALTQAVLPRDHVLLCVSGGTSALLGAPVDGISDPAFDHLWRLLLGAGEATDVRVMNVIRRRMLRWGGGRLAAALAGAELHQVLLSDVVNDDPAVIGSGPATPDDTTAADILALLRAHRLSDRVDRALLTHLQDVVAGRAAETPKPGDALFAAMDAPTVLGRTRIHEGLERAAADLGLPIVVHQHPLTGDSATAGRALAHALAGSAAPGLHCWTGETTVDLGERHGRGGRAQELALSVAHWLPQLGAAGARITLLAAGTDGRDGPTDAAGALVDAETVGAMAARGFVAATQLERHDAYPALDAAGALVRTGATGTNVADIVVALVR